LAKAEARACKRLAHRFGSKLLLFTPEDLIGVGEKDRRAQGALARRLGYGRDDVGMLRDGKSPLKEGLLVFTSGRQFE